MPTLAQLPDWSGKTLLIAEDLDDNYAVIAALLKRTHISLVRAHNGQQAIEQNSGRADINVILMDISMPDMNGIEALRMIRQQTPHKIVIAQTAHEFCDEIAAEGFDDFLQKPLPLKQLIDTLSKYLS